MRRLTHIWGPSFFPGMWPPSDAGFGRLLRLLVLGSVASISALTSLHIVADGCSSKLTQQKRLLALGWVSKAWTTLHESAEA